MAALVNDPSDFSTEEHQVSSKRSFHRFLKFNFLNFLECVDSFGECDNTQSARKEHSGSGSSL